MNLAPLLCSFTTASGLWMYVYITITIIYVAYTFQSTIMSSFWSPYYVLANNIIINCVRFHSTVLYTNKQQISYTFMEFLTKLYDKRIKNSKSK